MSETVEQERVISGRGLIKLDDRFRECKRIILYADVIRRPSSEYLNVTWNPDKGFFANAVFCLREYAGASYPMHYSQQMFTVHENDSQQLGASLVCALDNVLDSFVQYAIAQGIPYTKNNSITSHKYSAFVYDTFRFVCYGGCAISLRMVGELVEKCKPGDAPSDYPPPPPPPSREPVPPGVPVVVDKPYEDENPGSLDTVPDPIDRDPPPVELPFGEPCVLYNVRAVFVRSDGLEIDQTLQISGRILEVDIVAVSDGTGSLSYGVKGEELNPDTGVCNRPYRVQYISSPDGGSFDIASITPV